MLPHTWAYQRCICLAAIGPGWRRAPYNTEESWVTIQSVSMNARSYFAHIPQHKSVNQSPSIDQIQGYRRSAVIIKRPSLFSPPPGYQSRMIPLAWLPEHSASYVWACSDIFVVQMAVDGQNKGPQRVTLNAIVLLHDDARRTYYNSLPRDVYIRPGFAMTRRRLDELPVWSEGEKKRQDIHSSMS